MTNEEQQLVAFAKESGRRMRELIESADFKRYRKEGATFWDTLKLVLTAKNDEINELRNTINMMKNEYKRREEARLPAYQGKPDTAE